VAPLTAGPHRTHRDSQMKQVMHLQFQVMNVGGVQMKPQVNGEEMRALSEVPRQTLGRGSLFSDRSYERWWTFENLSRQGD